MADDNYKQGAPFDILDHRIIFSQPRLLSSNEAWQQHIPFALFIVKLMNPQVLVELGTFHGDSFCAFCQAVDMLGLETCCYAVDTWTGDVHTGSYGAEVLAELKKHHDPLYGRFSRLMQSTFDQALGLFSDGSIDLLHIDGCHTYDSVRHDFNSWLPKLSRRAVVLFHDINVREPEFGVWRLWDEISGDYPSFGFAHGNGLGVLAVGPEADAAVLSFLAAARDPHRRIAELFHALGSHVATLGRERRLLDELPLYRHELDHLRKQVRDKPALDGELNAARHQLEEARRDLHKIQGSYSWRAVTLAWNLAKKIRQLPGRARRSPAEASQPSDADAADDDHAPHTSLPPLAHLPLRPLISVLMPVYDTDPRWLQRAVASLQAQSYPHWELCLADDGSRHPETIAEVRRLAALDSRIRTHLAESNGGISSASNAALKLASGEFVALLDHDDELAPFALHAMVAELNRRPYLDILYSDEDKIDEEGARSEPFYKPDWSPEYFRGVMYVGHLLVARRTLIESVGGFDGRYDGVQDFELMLRLSERSNAIAHVPSILYHWRKIPGSIAAASDAKPRIAELQAAAVNAHLLRLGIPATARPHPAHPHRAILEHTPRASWPLVSIVIPTRDHPELIGSCLQTLHTLTSYPSFEVIVVDNHTTDPEAHEHLARYPIKIVPYNETFNYARANNRGVAVATGRYLVLLNNDTEIVAPDWLEVLVSHMDRPRVGAVGPLLVYPDHTVQHAGVALGMRGTADHVMRGFPEDADGYAGSLSCTREVSAVTAACMIIERERYLAVGGLREDYGNHYQDVDLCLRLRRAGLYILFTPRTCLVHRESASRAVLYDQIDRALLIDAWGGQLQSSDPFHHPRAPA